MPHIYDNLKSSLLAALRANLATARRADFCVGYFNLRGWDSLADSIDHFAGGDGACCRLLVGMTRMPETLMAEANRARQLPEILGGPERARLQLAAARSFRTQLETGAPSRQAQRALQQIARQLRAGKLRVRAVIGAPLHAKLYLVERQDTVVPQIGYVGSSNLTFAGLSGQGELNIDVTDQDAAAKLQEWFNQRWDDPTAYDISAELAELIETSWAAERLLHPYHVYLKMAYHLSSEAQRGEHEFQMPQLFRGVLLPFQERAVSLAAYYLHQRGGVLLGDVVGLGKTLMASAVAKIFQEDEGGSVLVICPPKLQQMWHAYLQRYQLAGQVVSLGRVTEELPGLMRYRLVVIDESHNVRNREGKRYLAIHDYVRRNESRVLLLTATPYNKQYTDLSNQLRLFLDENADLRVRPERYFQAQAERERAEADFIADFQASPRSLRAFDQSGFADDWRDLMRLFMVRRTRQFIIRTYAEFDEERQRPFVDVGEQRFYFPLRQPKTVTFRLDETDPADQYAALYQPEVVRLIEGLALPRYGLGGYLLPGGAAGAKPEERRMLEDLSSAGQRLMGFSRTNVFKRLESSGYSFLLSISHHIMRNLITLHALEQNEPIPIGPQNAAYFDPAVIDAEPEGVRDDADEPLETFPDEYRFETDLARYQARAAASYQLYRTTHKRRFKWLSPRFFAPQLARDLLADARQLLSILARATEWLPSRDAKLYALDRLLANDHAQEKVLIFTQFADTARYLGDQLRARGMQNVEVATGQSADPAALARRFSPQSNGGLRPGETELRVLIATDVLGEGQNLQDARVIVNYDLPWAIIRLIQRAGRVDRIGQRADTVLVYSFLPSAGIEAVIGLRRRLVARLGQNREVIGSDELFFGEEDAGRLRDLYTERNGVLDDDDDDDNDLASVALQIWTGAAEEDRRIAEALPSGTAAARPAAAGAAGETLVYLRFPDGADALVRVDADGAIASQSLSASFRAAATPPDAVALPLAEDHHDRVRQVIVQLMDEQARLGGQLGSLRSTRRQVYERLRLVRDRLAAQPGPAAQAALGRLDPAFNQLLRFPLKDQAVESLKRQLRLGIRDEALAELVVSLHADGRLARVTDEGDEPPAEPQVVCSIGDQPAGAP